MSKSSSSLGHLKAELAETTGTIPEDLIEKLNSNCSPPEELEAKDVHIRAMYIVSDEVNSYGGRFPIDGHEQLAGLLIDSPVLVGHRQDKLPVGRNFHSILVEREGRHWIKCYFYWLVRATGSENLLKNIDGGVYKECSIGFSFRLPECSICGKDIRLCEHEPFQKHNSPAGEVTCHFNYRQIEKVLETSLVYRGAIKNTSISNELSLASWTGPATARLSSLTSPDELDDGHRYLIIPRYAALDCSLTIENNELSLIDSDGRTLKVASLDTQSHASLSVVCDLPVRVVGMRGKERCSLAQLNQYLTNRHGPVSRLALLVMPSNRSGQSGVIKPTRDIELKPIPHRIGTASEIDQLANEVKTRDGVEIWQLGEAFEISKGKHYQPRCQMGVIDSCYSLNLATDSQAASLIIRHPELPEAIRVKTFSLSGSDRSHRCLAEGFSQVESDLSFQTDRSVPGRVTGVRRNGSGFSISLAGRLRGEYLLRPVKLRGRTGWLFYRQGDH